MDFPVWASTLVGADSYVEEPLSDCPTAVETRRTTDVLLTKEANSEQVQIARRLARQGAVLVQGPPGTGKTHTIANLIGDLLARGKSVLVTSHTTKALKVLRDQIVPELRDLSVSVLESGIEGRSQLEASVQGIMSRLGTDDSRVLRREAEQLTKRRDLLALGLATVDGELFEARRAEYTPIQCGDSTYAPAQAARLVADRRGQDDWIVDSLGLSERCPISQNEAALLYAANAGISWEEEKVLSAWPSFDVALIEPSVLRSLLRDEQGSPGPSDVLGVSRFAHEQADDGPATDDEVTKAALALGELRRWLDELSGWKMAVAQAAQVSTIAAIWTELMDQTGVTLAGSATARAAEARFGPRIPPELVDSPSLIFELEGIVAHLEAGKTLGLFTKLAHPAWKRIVEQVDVSEGHPTTTDHFAAVLAVVRFRAARTALIDRWDRQLATVGGPRIGGLGAPEEAASQHVQEIRELLAWPEVVMRPVLERMKDACFRGVGQPPSELPRLGSWALAASQAVERHRRALASTRASKTMGDAIARLDRIDKVETIRDLRNAISTRDADAYETAYSGVSLALSKRDQHERRNALLARVESVAPAWASALGERVPPHDRDSPPGVVSQAWLWCQLDTELSSRLSVSIERLAAEARKSEDELRQITRTLVEHLAWAAELERVDGGTKRALVDWSLAQRRIGRGTGKNAERLRRASRQYLREAKSAVPVWIMPLSRVADNFSPGSTRFDVVIVDEASQADVLALIALYMGTQVLVVGDDEQVSPEAVGQSSEVAKQLRGEYLDGLPGQDLWDGTMSVYDLARRSFPGLIALREHFRSATDIIEFSNDLCYRRPPDAGIRPLRDDSKITTRPHVVPVRVAGSSREGKVNRLEADTVASLLIAALEQPEYDGKTFGVVSLIGDEDDQPRFIETRLRENLSPVEVERRRIVCGNPAQFQGDERDVVFLSLVDVPAETGPLPLRSDDRFKKRFNVAASRARDQMWVVHSLDPGRDLKPGDLRRRLIEHAMDPGAWKRQLEKAAAYAESPFERDVLEILMNAGYAVTPQRWVGAYRIDMVVHDGNGQLAVECDGDEFHPLEKLQDDMDRQAVLV